LAAIYEKQGQTALAREARSRAGGAAPRPGTSPSQPPKPKDSKDFEDMLRNLETNAAED